MKDTIYERLIKKIGFVFETNENYYHIGQGLFRSADLLRVEDYKSYKAALSAGNLIEAKRLLKRITNSSSAYRDLENHKNSEKQLMNLLDRLSEDELASLQLQIDEYERLFSNVEIVL